ncbi:MAG: hypothetical protein ACJA1A_003871 [Saprospiraceae bacterium]|jgi:hypothetical protein
MITKLKKRLFYIASILLLTTSIAVGQEAWFTFKADAILSFEVEVPSEMGVKTKDITTDLGVMTTTTYAHEGGEGDMNFLYVVNVVEYPSGTFPLDSLDLTTEFLEQSIESMAEGIDGELVYKSELSEEGNGIGILFRLKYNEGYGVIKGKVFVKDDVFITLQVYTTKEKSLNDEMDMFLNSFRAKF